MSATPRPPTEDPEVAVVPGGPVVESAEAAVLDGLQRAAMYRLLALLLAYPTPPRLEEAASAARALDAGGLADALRDALQAVGGAAAGAEIAALADEHVFLFDRQVRCPPYESAYGEASQLAGKPASLADVAGFYRAFGLAPGEAQPDIEDHIVAELEFMSALALKEAWARGAHDTEGLVVTRHAQAAFLRDHLGRWAETFAEELAAASPLPYYAATAALLSLWVRAEIEALEAAPDRVERHLGHDPLHDDEFACPMASPESPEETGSATSI